MDARKYILSCDWGTSSFRLRLVELATGGVKGEVTSQYGIAKVFATYNQAVADENVTPGDRASFYTDFIQTQIQILSGQLAQPLGGIPVLLSGMASASIGMVELPYATLPFALDGTNAITTLISATGNFPHDVLLISGVRSEDDVIRGEETQLIGLANKLKIEQGTCVFPGTHSKHMYVRNNHLTDFKTYMTGELFQTIASHTILKASVEQSAEVNFEAYEDVFSQGVLTATKQPDLLHVLFTVRTAELFKKFTRVQNYYYLSGILIGQELVALKETPGEPITLCCGSNLLPFYKTAINCIGLSGQTSIVSGDIIDVIAIEGQLQLYRLSY